MSLLAIVRHAFLDDAEPAPTVDSIVAARAEKQARQGHVEQELARIEELLTACADERRELVHRRGCDALADERLDELEGKEGSLLRQEARAREELTLIADDVKALDEQHAAAEQRQQVERLNAALVVLAAAGLEADTAFNAARVALDKFIDADRCVTRLGVAVLRAQQVNQQSAGRYVGERVQDCLSHYFVSALALAGTEMQLSVTRAKAGMNFVAASQRPFAAAAGAKTNVD